MTPTFNTTFNLDDLEAIVADTFNYNTLIYSAAYGNVTAKQGNSIFHQNTDFDNNADIVIGTNSSVDIPLPTQNGVPLSGSYRFIYNVLIEDEVLAYASTNSGFNTVNAPGAATFSTITLTSPPSDLEEVIVALLAAGLNVQVGLYDVGDGLIVQSNIVSSTGSVITFAQVTEANFANIAKVRIIGTNTYTKTSDYLFNGCPNVDVQLNVTADCYRSQLTAADVTNYPANLTTLTRELTIRYPLLSNGTPVASPSTTSDASLTVGPNIWTGGYTISLSSQMVYVQTDDLTVIETVIKYSNPNVQCDANLCKALECINGFRVKYMAAQKSGARNLGELMQQNLNILIYCNTYNIAVQCQNTTLASCILTELIEYMGVNNCSCGCNDTRSDTAEPTEIFPVYYIATP